MGKYALLADAWRVRRDRQKVAKAFGYVLKRERLQLGVSQEEMANLADIDRTLASKIERGLSQPSLATVILLAEALKLSPGELVNATAKRMNA